MLSAFGMICFGAIFRLRFLTLLLPLKPACCAGHFFLLLSFHMEPPQRTEPKRRSPGKPSGIAACSLLSRWSRCDEGSSTPGRTFP